MPKFTASELEVMKILWEHGEQKPAEIQRRFPREIKNPALRSILTILTDKGHAERRREGKAYFYRAATPRERAFRTALSDIVGTFFRGSTEAFVARLIEDERLTETDLRRLAQAARGSKPKGKKEGGRA